MSLPGKNEKRPLGIPIMYDRALQGVVKTALEPEWEASFEATSYGFRPGRSCHDAIKHIKDSIQTKAKYVLDADIAKCFDRINHEALLQKLNHKGKVRRQVKAWLKSGVIDFKRYSSTNEGTPQGGVVSPLLANIALHGLVKHLYEYMITVPLRFPSGKLMPKRNRLCSLTVIRYIEEQLNQNSQNSSRPPSSDGFVKPEKSQVQKKKKAQKKPSQGSYSRKKRKLYPIEACKEVYSHVPEKCRHCGEELFGEDAQPYRHQIVEIPTRSPYISPYIIEHQQHQLECACCGRKTRGTVPKGVQSTG